MNLTKKLKITFVSLMILFLFLLLQVLTSGFIIDFDQWVSASIVNLQMPWLTTIMIAITTLSSTKAMLFFSLVLLCFLLWTKKQREVILLVMVMLGALLLQIGLKLAVRRERPLNGLVDASHDIVSGSFPSGHAMMTTAFVLVFLYTTYDWWKNLSYREFIFGDFLLFVLLVGFSRIYLSVHWTSDVVAGFSLGIIWCIFVYLFQEHIFPTTLS